MASKYAEIRSNKRLTRVVCFFLLLARAACVRIQTPLTIHLSRQRQNHSEWNISKHFGFGRKEGHRVCRKRDLRYPSRAIHRYRSKMVRLVTLSVELLSEGHHSTRLQPWLELKRRIENFQSCKVLLGSKKKIPPELEDAILHQKPTLDQVMLVPMGVIEAAREQHADYVYPTFEEIPGCHFSQSHLNLVGALADTNADASLHKQLFGAACNHTSTVRYLNRLSKAEQESLRKTVDILAKSLRLQRSASELKACNNRMSQERLYREILSLAAEFGRADATSEIFENIAEEVAEGETGQDDSRISAHIDTMIPESTPEPPREPTLEVTSEHSL